MATTATSVNEEDHDDNGVEDGDDYDDAGNDDEDNYVDDGNNDDGNNCNGNTTKMTTTMTNERQPQQ